MRQMRDQGMKTIMISGDGITDNEFASIGGPGVEGTLMSFGPEPRNNPNAKDVVAEFKAKGYDPEGYTLYSYAGMQIIKQAIEKANSTDPHKVADVMHSGMAFKTVLGDIAYDAKGDRTTMDYVWYVWKKDADGKITSIRCDRRQPAQGLVRDVEARRDPAGFIFCRRSDARDGTPGARLTPIVRAAGRSRSAMKRRSARRRSGTARR